MCCLTLSVTLFLLYHYLVLLYGWTLGAAPYIAPLCGVYVFVCVLAAAYPTDEKLMRRPMISRTFLVTNTAMSPC